MERTGMIGVHLGKRSFQFRGMREDWSAVFRKKMSRERFLAEVPGRGRSLRPCKLAGVPAIAAEIAERSARNYAGTGGQFLMLIDSRI